VNECAGRLPEQSPALVAADAPLQNHGKKASATTWLKHEEQSLLAAAIGARAAD
jgi:hypothetical protein